MSKAVDNALNELNSMLDNIRKEPQLQQAAASTGVTDGLLGIGRGLYKQLQSTQQEYKRLKAKRPVSLADIKMKRAALWAIYIEHIKASRSRVLDDGIKALLQLEGSRESEVDAVHEQVRNFYDSALDNEAAQSALARAGIVRTELEAGRTAVLAVDTALSVDAAERKQLPELSQRMRKELRYLRRWMRSTRGLMEPALGDEPHLKTLIGITEPAPRKKEKKAAEEEAVPE